MSEFDLHEFSAMAYESKQIITFSANPTKALSDIDEEMKYHAGVSSVQVSNLTQNEFDYFIKNYGDNFQSIYFFQNTKVKDLSALSSLRKVKYLLFYNVSGEKLWDMRKNENLQGIMISDCKKLLYDLEEIQYAPNLEELLLFSSMHNKYTVKTITPLKNCRSLKRLSIEFNTADKSFDPDDFGHLEVLRYQCDRKRNFTY
ncbi:MAG: hypothetical protein IKM61_09640 [Eubacteriaceae bacterium]|nr:hypothetical protein [Eubacteriaceae bacterium]